MRRLILLVILLQGCTSTLWSPTPTRELVLVDGFYINKSTGDLFVSARNKAYIFQIKRELSDALSLTKEAIFYPVFKDFTLDENDQIKGSFDLILIEDDTTEEFQLKLKSIGFVHDSNINRLQQSNQLIGKQYLVEGDLPLEKLGKEYRVLITHMQEEVPVIGKIIASPATITIDAIVTAPTVFLGATVMATGSP